MPTRISSGAQIGIEIGGKPAGWLSSTALPRIDWLRPDGSAARDEPIAASLGPFAASASISGAGVLLDWLLTLPRGKVQASDGAVVEADLNFDAKRRIDWTGGQITEIAWPTLGVAESKKPFVVAFKWQPSTIKFSKGSGKIAAAAGKKAKFWMPSNFRLRLGAGAIDGKHVTRVELPALRATAATASPGTGRRPAAAPAVQIGPLRIDFGAAGRDAALAFAQNAMKAGVRPATDGIDIVVELLDAALARTLGTIQLAGCALLAYEEAPVVTASEAGHGVTLLFSVEALDLVV